MGVREKYLYYNRKYFTIRHLDRLHEGVEQDSDADGAAQELDETRGAEEAEEADLDDPRGVDDAPGHGDEVERVPRVFEVRLRHKQHVNTAHQSCF